MSSTDTVNCATMNIMNTVSLTIVLSNLLSVHTYKTRPSIMLIFLIRELNRLRKSLLTNIDDTPDTIKTIKLVDPITASAYYAPEAKTLSVFAKSSDEVEPPTLSTKRFGDINPETGILVVRDVSYISPTITITSSNNGTVTIPIAIVSSPVSSVELIANAGLDQIDIKQGMVVTLDGHGSENAIAYSWKQKADQL